VLPTKPLRTSPDQDKSLPNVLVFEKKPKNTKKRLERLKRLKRIKILLF